MLWRNPKNFRKGLAAAAASLAGACSSVGGGDVGNIYSAVKTIWRGEQKVSIEQAAAVPYASLGLRLGSNSQLMLLLATDDGKRRLWTSASRLALTTTQDGRIVRTAGLKYNLTGIQRPSQSRERQESGTIRWAADYPDIGLYGMPIVCQLQPIGNETIMILGQKIRTRHTDESCAAQSDQIDWSFKNSFWIDPTTLFVWRSIQHVHPKLDSIEIEILRPPG